MSKIGLSLSINVSEIEKARLFKGKKGTYLDMTVFVDIDNKDQYDNNGMITQTVTKEEQANGIKGPILGNCKVFWKGENQQQRPQSQSQGSQQYQKDAQQTQVANSRDNQGTHFDNDFDDDIPFR